MSHVHSAKPSTLVISVGGSLVVPNGKIDHAFLQSFKKLLLKHIKLGWRFVIVVGGGGTARQYQDTARHLGPLTRDDLDWLGIHATRLNGHLLRTILREVAHPHMLKNPTAPLRRWMQPVLVAAGWKPGWSTDYVAVRLAKRLGSSLVVNLSNIDYVYTQDPRTHKDAEMICDIGWKEFRQMVGNEWDPGMNVPFDPVASRLAQRSKMTVTILNGAKLENMEELLKGKKFVGTVIS